MQAAMKIDANKASTPDEPPTPSPSLFSHLPSFQVPTAQLPLSAPQKTYNQTPPSYETLSSTKLLDNFVSICEALRGVSKDKRATVRISFGTFECVGAGETQKGSEDGTGGGNMSNSSEIQSRDVIFKKFFVDSVTKNVDLTKDDIFKYLSSDESTMRFTLFLSIPLSSHLSEKTIGDGLCCPRVLEMLRKRYEFYQRYGSSSAKSFVPIDYNLFDERQRISFIEKAFDPDLVGYLSETNKTFVNLAKEWINKSGENDEYYYINPNRTAAQLRDVYVSYMTSYPRLPSQINGEPIWADQDYCRQVYPYNKFSRTLFVEDAFGYAKMHDAIRSTQGNSSSAASTSTSDAAASQSLNLSSFSTFTSQLLPSTTALFSSSPSPSSPKKNDPPPLVWTPQTEISVMLYYSSVCDPSTDTFQYSQLRAIASDPFPNYFCLSGSHFYLLEEPDHLEALRIEEAVKSLSSLILRVWEERIKPCYIRALQREAEMPSMPSTTTFLPEMSCPIQ